MTTADPPALRMTDVIEFLRARLAELERADWHTLDCRGVAGPAGSCCAARLMASAQAKMMRQRIGRYVEVVSHASTPSGAAEWWEGMMTAMWLEVRADASLWSRHADYRQHWAL